MRRKKNPSELAPSVFAKYRANGKIPYSFLYRDSVTAVFNFPISADAKLTFFRLQPVLKNRYRPGYLFEDDGEAVSIEFLALSWGKEEADLVSEIGQLIKYKLLKRDGDLIYDPMMIAGDEKEDQSSQNQEVSDSPSLGKVPKSRKFGKTAQNSKVPTEEKSIEKNSRGDDRRVSSASSRNKTDHSSAPEVADSDPGDIGTSDPRSSLSADARSDSDPDNSSNPSASTSVLTSDQENTSNPRDTSIVLPSDPEITLEDIEKLKGDKAFKHLCFDEELAEWRKSCKERRVVATMEDAKLWIFNADNGLTDEARKLRNAPFYPAEDFKLMVDWINEHCDTFRYEWAGILCRATNIGWAFQDEKTGDRWGKNNPPIESPSEEVSDLELAPSLEEHPAAEEVPY